MDFESSEVGSSEICDNFSFYEHADENDQTRNTEHEKAKRIGRVSERRGYKFFIDLSVPNIALIQRAGEG